MRLLKCMMAASVVAVVGGCDLAVDNLESPDVTRVFALPITIEQTIGAGYQQCRNTGMQNGSAYTIASVWSVEGHSALNNFQMGPRGGIPRAPVNSNRANPSFFQEFSQWSRQARTLANAVAALDRLVEGGGTLGSPARNLRGRAWGFFVVACNLGYMSMLYDSAGIVYPATPSDETPPLSHSRDVMNAALAQMDSAIAIASTAAAAPGFPTEASWLSGSQLTRDEFVQFVRSYKARFRAAINRTPAERNAVEQWNQILADAENGLTETLEVLVGSTTGWNKGWPGGTMHTDAAWHQISPLYWGFADVSALHVAGSDARGDYTAWLARPLGDRGPFLIITPDLRYPQGITRAEQRASSDQFPSDYTGLPYIQNRSDQDTPGDPWGTSDYDHYRYRYVQASTPAVVWPEFHKEELDLLRAEALYRLGRYADAAAAVDISRVGRGGLPSLVQAGITSATARLSGNCVPRSPTGPGNSLQCGDLWEALKYEKRVELAFNYFHGWFFDSRGWGDLIVNTPLLYPVPYEELDARQLPYYNVGGGGIFSAARGTYGF